MEFERLKSLTPEEFKQLKQEYFLEISNNKSEFFNFFYENNSIFKKISEEDYIKLSQELIFSKLKANKVLLSYYPLFFTADRFIIPYFFPKFKRIPYFRPLFFGIKYVCFPFLVYGFSLNYFNKRVDKCFLNFSEKYNFSYGDYLDSMEIIEVAAREDKLEELLKN